MAKTKKQATIQRKWYLADAKDQILGRLSSRIAKILMGKHKSSYVPYWDLGDYVVVINAKEVAVTGRKEEGKIYYRHTGYPGGLKEESLKSLRARRPEEVIRRAVVGMLPKNRLAREMIKKLYIYPGSEHPFKDRELKEL